MESGLTDLLSDTDIKLFLTLDFDDKKKQIENCIFMMNESHYQISLTLNTSKIELNEFKQEYNKLCDMVDRDFFEKNLIDTVKHDKMKELSLTFPEYKSKIETLLSQEKFIEKQINKFKSFNQRFLSSSSTLGFT
jgi:hypothetical protein